jgi:hypothetical protein
MDRVEIRQGETEPNQPEDMKHVDEFETVELGTSVGQGQPEQVEEHTPDAPEDRPGWLPEKFSSPEHLAHAYKELEQKQSQPVEAPEATEDTEEAGEEYVDDLTAENLQAYTNEYAETGQLSEESYAELENRFGVPRDLSEAYVAGQGARHASQQMEIMSTVGGPENYKSMIKWAVGTLPQEEQQAFDNTIKGGDHNSIKMAVQGVWARYEGARGERGTLIQGGTPSNTSGAFASIAEITEAMKDPRYSKDPAYRRQVEERLNNSKVI